jgi:hypothetical protein
MRGLRGFGQVLAVGLAACAAGTEPSTDPRDVRVDPDATGRVSGKVRTSGPIRSDGEQGAAETMEAPDSGWVRIGPVAGQRLKPSRPLAGVVVELGIVRFDRSSDTTQGTARAMVVPWGRGRCVVGAGDSFPRPRTRRASGALRSDRPDKNGFPW